MSASDREAFEPLAAWIIANGNGERVNSLSRLLRTIHTEARRQRKEPTPVDAEREAAVGKLLGIGRVVTAPEAQ